MRDIIGNNDGSVQLDGQEPAYCTNGTSPDDIVITGVAGRFPSASGVEDFKEKIYSKYNFYIPCDSRWKRGSYNIPFNDFPFLTEYDKFDYEFFGIPFSNSKQMTPKERMLLEVCYEAISDSGYDPDVFDGKRVAVYCAHLDTSSDEHTDFYDKSLQRLISHFFCFLSNKFSYLMNFKGRSMLLDTACSSYLNAVDLAVCDMLLGNSEAAVVCTVQMIENPYKVYKRYVSKIVGECGICHPFDHRADGTVCGEMVGAIFLQRASAARRIYANVLGSHVMSSGFVPDGITVPDVQAEVELFEKALEKAKVDPSDVSFIEAHGTGTLLNDPAEVESVARVFCKNRKSPILIGSIKSNVGHSEASSGFTGILKCIFAFETGVIAPNDNFVAPLPSCKPLFDGRVQVVTEPTPLPSPIAAVNSFGFGGTIGQVILKGNTSKKLDQSGKDKSCQIPQLLLVSARSGNDAKRIIGNIITKKPNQEFFSLFHHLAYSSPKKRPFRGYALLSDDPIVEVKKIEADKRQVWFVFTGMGCQYPGMALDLMQVKVFGDSMRLSARVLKKYDIDLLELLREDADHLMKHRRILPAIIAICAIQIALFDTLTALGIQPDGIIGHSTGEIACAYADGCLSAEQTIEMAYWRSRAIEDSNLVEGKMAAVGLTWEEVKKRCPENVFPACHNGTDSVTIAGLVKPVEKFLEELKKEGIFIRDVNAYGWGFHSKLIEPAKPAYKEVMEKFAPVKKRSKKWLSTAYPPEQWHLPEVQTSSFEYFSHNMVSPVRFADALAYIPSNAIIIELSPHSLMLSVLKRSLGTGASYIGLMKRKSNNLEYFLSSIGKLYAVGLNPKVQNIYPTVNYPVPRGTPCISDFISWDHSISWPVLKHVRRSGGCVKISAKVDEQDFYLVDHCVGGRSLYPATGYLVLAWEALASCMESVSSCLPVIIEDFKIHRATVLKTDRKDFWVSITAAEGHFDIMENGALVASGKIRCDPEFKTNVSELEKYDSTRMISGSEIYDDIKILGYDYGPAFQCLHEVDVDGSMGFVRWEKRWIPYLDAHLLFFKIGDSEKDFAVPTRALSVKLNPFEFQTYLDTKLSGNSVKAVPVVFDKDTSICSSPGVEIRELKLDIIATSQSAENHPVLDKYEFVPYISPLLTPPKPKQKYLEYLNACNDVAIRIASSKDKSALLNNEGSSLPSGNVDEYLNTFDTDNVLLKTLYDISCLKDANMFHKDAKKLLNSFISDMGNDLTFKIILDEYHLAAMLGIVLENSFRKLNLVEVCRHHSPVVSTVLNIIQRTSTLQTSYTLFHSKTESLNEDLFNLNNTEIKSLNEGEEMQKQKDNDVVIGSFLFGDNVSLKNHILTLCSMGHNKSFLLFYHRDAVSPAENFLYSVCNVKLEIQSCEAIKNIFAEQNLVILSKMSDGNGNNLYLLRRNEPCDSHRVDAVVRVKSGLYKDWVEDLKVACSSAIARRVAKVWVVAEDGPFNGIVGLMKCLQQEPGGKLLRCVFIVNDGSNPKPPPFNTKNAFYKEVIEKDLVYNIYHNGVWGSYRFFPCPQDAKEAMVEHSFLNIMKYGDLSTFRWIESPMKYEVDKNWNMQNLIHVCYAALNFRDVMYATAKLRSGLAREEVGNDPCIIGSEFSGVRADGQRVMGVSINRSMATTIHRPVRYMFDVPSHWTLEEAATVPVVYLTCYSAMIVVGQLSKGESILIHSGAGGIGTAAIRIALSLNCEVFTTVGTKEKQAYLKKLFPQLKDENIGCSRDTSFEIMIKKQTKGRGVDLVLNSLSEDKLQASARCLAEQGRFMEIGKYDMVEGHKIGLDKFFGGKTFHCVSWGDFSSSETLLKELMYDGIKKGVVVPLERSLFPSSEVENAFRFMASGKHIGKVVLKVRDEPKHGAVPEILKQHALLCNYFYRHKVYIVIGGLGGFGMQVVQWLIEKGAVNIIVTSRSGVRGAFHQMYLNQWKKRQANVTVSRLDAGKKEEARQLLQEASKIGPVGGIFNSALVLRDALLENQDSEKFSDVCSPKVAATLYLDELTRKMCPSLDLFVCFSSVSCGKGNAGQCNYGYANSVMEMVCRKRRQENLHGLAIQWGIIGDVGYAARQKISDAAMCSYVPQSVKSCLNALDYFLLQNDPVVTSYVNVDASKAKKQKKVDVMSLLARAIGYDDISSLDTTKTFLEMGADSMLAVEILQLLEQNYDIILSIKELQKLTMGDIKKMVEPQGGKESSTKETQFKTEEKKLSSTSSHAIFNLNENKSGLPVFFIHYLEKAVKRLQQVCSLLDNPCYGVICPASVPVKSIEDLVQFYIEEISKRADHGAHIVSYSDAASLAFEIAAGQTCNKKCINIVSFTILDGALNLVNALESHHSLTNTTELEIKNLLTLMMPMCSSEKIAEVKKELQLKYPLEKVDCLRKLCNVPSEVKLDSDDVNAVKRFMQIQTLLSSHSPRTRYPKDITVIETTQMLTEQEISEVKRKISELCTGKVTMHRISRSSEHASKDTAEKIAAYLKTVVKCI